MDPVLMIKNSMCASDINGKLKRSCNRTDPGTAVTITSAPTFFRKIVKTFDQYSIRRLGKEAGPRTSNPYSPVDDERVRCLQWTASFHTMTEHNRISWPSYWLVQCRVLHEAMYSISGQVFCVFARLRIILQGIRLHRIAAW